MIKTTDDRGKRVAINPAHVTHVQDLHPYVRVFVVGSHRSSSHMIDVQMTYDDFIRLLVEHVGVSNA